jgi:hypothetical protein
MVSDSLKKALKAVRPLSLVRHSASRFKENQSTRMVVAISSLYALGTVCKEEKESKRECVFSSVRSFGLPFFSVFRYPSPFVNLLLSTVAMSHISLCGWSRFARFSPLWCFPSFFSLSLFAFSYFFLVLSSLSFSLSLSLSL